MVYLITSSHVCTNISMLILRVVVNNNLKLPILILTLYFKIQVAHFHCSLGNILSSFKPCMGPDFGLEDGSVFGFDQQMGSLGWEASKRGLLLTCKIQLFSDSQKGGKMCLTFTLQ